MRRFFGGRQPLCGIGVTSEMLVILKPTALSARTADSRPGPGPLMRTSRFFTPHSWAARPARLGRDLRGERRALARALEAGARREVAHDERVALAVGDGDDGVVEGRVDVGDALGHVLLDLLAHAG